MKLRLLFSTASLLGLAPALHALDVIDYQPVLNARFAGGWPTAPVPTSSPGFIGAKFDWSGVGWRADEPTRNVALITPRHFVFSMHHSIDAGNKLRFVDARGRLREYIVEKTQSIVVKDALLGGEVKSDLGVGTLLHSIPSTDHIACYPTAVFGTRTKDYLGKPLLLYGHGPDGPRLGRNEIVDATLGDGEDPHLVFLAKGLVSGMAKSESGDSGGPSFFVVDGKIAIAGTHHEVEKDVLIPGLVEQINAILKMDGYSLGVLEAKR